MNLEEYRRAYMRAESFGNTPKRLIERFMNLGKSIIKLPGSITKDSHERKRRKEEFRKAWQEIKSEGINAENITSLLDNGPRISTYTSKSISNIAKSSLGAVKSLNELGQTASSIVGTTRQNSYDGQDLEKGISFALMAKSYIDKPMKIPPIMMNSVKFGVIGGTIIVNSINLRKPIHKNNKEELKRDKFILNEHENER